MTRRVAWARLALVLWAACLSPVGGCRERSAARPLIREDGAVLSELALPEGTAKVTLPLRFEGGLLTTDAVRINGRDVGRMAIDTGADWTLLDRTVAARLGITDAAPWKTRPGAAPPDGLYRIASLDAGELGLRNHVVGVADLSSTSVRGRTLAGVVGGDVLGCLPFTVDYGRKELTMYARSSFDPPAGADAYRLFVDGLRTRGSFVSANPAAGQPQVDGRIDGTPARLMLDTAFVGTLVLRPHFARRHPRLADPNSPVVGRATGAAGPGGTAGRSLRRAAVEHVDALGARFHCAGTALVLSSEPDPPGPRKDPSAALLGSRFLAHGRLTFDYARRRLWVEWPGERANR